MQGPAAVRTKHPLAYWQAQPRRAPERRRQVASAKSRALPLSGGEGNKVAHGEVGVKVVSDETPSEQPRWRNTPLARFAARCVSRLATQVW